MCLFINLVKNSEEMMKIIKEQQDQIKGQQEQLKEQQEQIITIIPKIGNTINNNTTNNNTTNNTTNNFNLLAGLLKSSIAFSIKPTIESSKELSPPSANVFKLYSIMSWVAGLIYFKSVTPPSEPIGEAPNKPDKIGS